MPLALPAPEPAVEGEMRIEHRFAPSQPLLTIADRPANVPVQQDEFPVHRSRRGGPRHNDALLQFSDKARVVRFQRAEQRWTPGRPGSMKAPIFVLGMTGGVTEPRGRYGDVSEPSLISHRIAASSRILCAAPSYVKRHGAPRTASELTQHECVLLRERNEPFGTWRLHGPRGAEDIKVGGSLASNDIDVVLRWAHDGHGIVMSGDWLFAASLESGTLVHVLPEWHQPADINAVSSVRSAQSAKVRACIDLLREAMAGRASPADAAQKRSAAP